MKTVFVLFMTIMVVQAQALTCKQVFSEQESSRNLSAEFLFQRAVDFIDPAVLLQFRADLQRTRGQIVSDPNALLSAYAQNPSQSQFVPLLRALESSAVIALRPFLHRVDLDTYFDIYQEALFRVVRITERIVKEQTGNPQLPPYRGIVQRLEGTVASYLRLQVEQLRPEIAEHSVAGRLWKSGISQRDIADIAKSLGISYETALEWLGAYRDHQTEPASSPREQEILVLARDLNISVSILLARLTPIEERVIRSIHLLRLPINNVANVLSLSRERIRKIEMKAMIKLKRLQNQDIYSLETN